MPPIYGDSFGDLSRNAQAASSSRQAALANALNTAASALASARDFHQRQVEDDTRNYFAWKADSERDTERKQNQANLDRNFALATRNADLSEKQVDLYAKKLDQPTPAEVRDHDLTFNQADADAASGTFESPQHVSQLYPKLSTAEAKVLATRSTSARRQIVADYTTANNAASILNTERDLNDRIYKVQTMATALKSGEGTALNPLNWSWAGGANRTAETTLNDLDQEQQRTGRQLQQIAPLAATLKKDKNVNALVTFDAQSGRYAPAIPTPRWMTPAAGNQPAAPSAPANPQNPAAPTARASASAATPPASQPKYKPQFYDRVNALIASGADPASAKRQALVEAFQPEAVSP